MTVRCVHPTDTHGWIWQLFVYTSWAAVIAASSSWVVNEDGTASIGYDADASAWQNCRGAFDMETGYIPSDATITTAKLRLYQGCNTDAALYQSYLLSSDHADIPTNDDYDQFGTTKWSDSFRYIAGDGDLATLNSTGIAALGLGGSNITKFGFRVVADLDALDPAPALEAFNVGIDRDRKGQALIGAPTNVTFRSATLNGSALWGNSDPILAVRYTGGTEEGTIYPRYRYKWWKNADGEGTALYSDYYTDTFPGEALPGYDITGLVPATQYKYKVEIDDIDGVQTSATYTLNTAALPVHGGFAWII